MGTKEANVAGAFGCAHCAPDDPDEARGRLQGLTIIAKVINTSHFSIDVRKCGVCGQHWLEVYTELVDWNEGKDSQANAYVPVTQEEVMVVREEGSAGLEQAIERMVRGRRYLDYAEVTCWRESGFFVRPHH